MLEALTGIGLSASAGLNAWIPLLAIGLLNRYTSLIALPSGWNWLSNGWVLLILAVLLAVEIVADKVPVVDSVNDVIHTVVRPTAGGLAFGASANASTVTVSNPGDFFSSHQGVAVISGVLIALFVHLTKASARPVINTVTGGIGGPVVSTAEDVTSAGLSVIAIVLPILVVVFMGAFIFFVFWARKRIKARRARKREAKARRQSQTPSRAAWEPTDGPRQ